ncbi:unnamed protein product [Phytophthora fragariaefolia]|uniref:Unnamed protein product n=1 Tax=Phytophthora fragariaefolia TaxID=1490495 RepID=A0A9W7CQB3_9STRA|nr:unnamed protein product [Phytophthora fragariaefolia]
MKLSETLSGPRLVSGAAGVASRLAAPAYAPTVDACHPDTVNGHTCRPDTSACDTRCLDVFKCHARSPSSSKSSLSALDTYQRDACISEGHQPRTTEDTENPVTEVPESITEITEPDVTGVRDAPTSPDRGHGNGVTLDDFDSDNFLDALRRDRLFEGGDSDLNVGVDDWLLALDSDAEGDEESILLDVDDSDDEGEGNADVPGAVSDAESVEEFGGADDNVHVEFELAGFEQTATRRMGRSHGK